MGKDRMGHAAAMVQIGDIKLESAEHLNGITAISLNEVKLKLGTWYKYYREDMEKSVLKGPDGKLCLGVQQLVKIVGYDDTLSYWTDKNGVINFSVDLRIKSQAVAITRVENTYNIKVFVNFTGQGAGMECRKDWQHKNETKTYAQLVEDGFKFWSNRYHVDNHDIYVNVDVKVKGRDTFNKMQKIFNVYVNKPNDNGSAVVSPRYGWAISRTDATMIINPATGINECWEYNITDAAHEFGHKLGLSDAYDVDSEQRISDIIKFFKKHYTSRFVPDEKNFYRKAAPESTYIDGVHYEIPENDIMRGGDRVTAYDVKLVLNAFKYDRYQFIPEKSNIF